MRELTEQEIQYRDREFKNLGIASIDAVIGFDNGFIAGVESQQRAVERLRAQNAEMLETLQSIGDKINNDFLDFADPSGLIYVPLNRAEIDTIRAAIASATAEEAGGDG